MSPLTEALCFDVVGSLITSQGNIPTYTRFSRANAEYVVNNSTKTFAFATHQPRFSSQGSIFLEAEATNFLDNPLDLDHPSWIKGSNIFIQPDSVQGLGGKRDADRIVVSNFNGNTAAQTLTKTLYFESAKTLTAKAYLRLAGGRLGPNDAIRITGDVLSPATVFLAPILNDQLGNNLKVPLTFTTAGSEVADPTDDTVNRAVVISLYLEKSASLDWLGGQIEEGSYDTSFIDPENGSRIRDGDYLNYSDSPVAGLASFVTYLNLENWRGNGNLINAGNFQLSIDQGKLKAVCGTVTCTDPDPLPASAQIACRVSQGLSRVQIYVNQVLKAKATLSSYQANASEVTIAGEGFRQIRCLYLFNRDLADGSIDTNQKVLSDLLTLHTQDSLITDLAEGHATIVLPAVPILAKGSVSVKYNQIPIASQPITGLTTGPGAVAQVDQVTVELIENAAVAQTDFVQVNNTIYQATSDATPTKPEIAALLAGLINQSPKKEPVTASYTAGNDFFLLTADTAGDDFLVSISDRLSQTNETANQPAANVVTVSNAVDFVRGMAQIYRRNAYICDVAIAAINTSNNQITIQVLPNSLFRLLQQGDVLVQSRWNLAIGPNNVFVHHLEDYSDIKVSDKSPEGCVFANLGLTDRTFTPYLKVTL
jgi:hypothetical protein